MDAQTIDALEKSGDYDAATAQRMRDRLGIVAPATDTATFDPTQSLTTADDPSMVPPAFEGTPSVAAAAPVAPTAGATANWDVAAKQFNGPPMSASGPLAHSTSEVPPSTAGLVDYRQQPISAPAASAESDITKITRTSDDPAHLKKIQEHLDAGSKALIAEGAAQEAQAKERALGSQVQSQTYAKQIEDEHLRQAAEQTAIDAKQKDYQDEMDKYQNDKLDSGRWFADSSTGTKILAGIAVGLGAMGQAYGAAENPAVGIIQKAIDQDIAQQKFNIDQHGKVVEGKRTLYTDLVKKYGDERAARAAYQEAVLRKISMETEARAASSNSEIVKQNAAKQVAQLGLGVETAAAERNKTVTETVKKTGPVAGAKAALTPGQIEADKEFAKTHNDWKTYDRATVDDSIKKLEEAKTAINAHKKDLIPTSGAISGYAPDAFNKTNAAIRDRVQAATVSGMKAAFGPRPSQLEAQWLKDLSYNQKQTPEENVNRIDDAINKLKAQRDAKEERSKFFEQNRGSLAGYQSK